jgi:4a-hydroxytetrahydrobiopterin dehydratase
MTDAEKGSLSDRRCSKQPAGGSPLSAETVLQLSTELIDWRVIDGHHLEKEIRFPNFAGALAWVNAAGAVSEKENHHPELCFTWGRVTARIWTHTVDGLTENDFILAAKFDRIPAS